MNKAIKSIIGVTALSTAVFFSRKKTVTGQKKEYYEYPPERAVDLLEEQVQKEKKLEEAAQGKTIANPYICVDPFGSIPLSALIIFETEEEAQVSFNVQGKTTDVDIFHELKAYRKFHRIPIIGLYPDMENKVKLLVKGRSGNKREKTVSMVTEPLPKVLPQVDILTINETKMENQTNTLNVAIPGSGHPYGFDKHGDIRWYGTYFAYHIVKELKNGRLLYLTKQDNTDHAYNRLFEMDYLGRLYNAFRISEEAAAPESEGADIALIHHEIAALSSGNLLLSVHDGSGIYVEDTLVEIERISGRTVKKIDLKGYFNPSVYQTYPEQNGVKDWMHQNAVFYNESDNSIIVSARHQDAILKIDYQTEALCWILAHPEKWDDSMQAYLIEGKDEYFNYPGGQHDVTILPDQDGDPDTVDLLLYNNNNPITRGENDTSRTYSEAVQYRINEKTKTAELIWSYGKARGEDFFTEIVGSARRLPKTGNRIIGFGHVQDGLSSYHVEVTESGNPEVVFEALSSGFQEKGWSYRTVRRYPYTGSWTDDY